jgi:hypothetical protein
MMSLPLIVSCLALLAGADDRHDANAKPAPPHAQLRGQAVTQPSAPRPPPPPAPAQDQGHRHHDHGHRVPGLPPIPWAPLRVFQGVDELQLEGPGAITPVQNPDALDAAVVGRWRVVVPVVTAVDDGYGRIDTFRESHDLGRLTIQSAGDYLLEVPGQLRSAGALTEVTGANVADAHFWSLEANGQTLVIAPGSDGSLLLYDAANNAFYARAIAD